MSTMDSIIGEYSSSTDSRERYELYKIMQGVFKESVENDVKSVIGKKFDNGILLKDSIALNLIAASSSEVKSSAIKYYTMDTIGTTTMILCLDENYVVVEAVPLDEAEDVLPPPPDYKDVEYEIENAGKIARIAKISGYAFISVVILLVILVIFLNMRIGV